MSACATASPLPRLPRLPILPSRSLALSALLLCAGAAPALAQPSMVDCATAEPVARVPTGPTLARGSSMDTSQALYSANNAYRLRVDSTEVPVIEQVRVDLCGDHDAVEVVQTVYRFPIGNIGYGPPPAVYFNVQNDCNLIFGNTRAEYWLATNGRDATRGLLNACTTAELTDDGHLVLNGTQPGARVWSSHEPWARSGVQVCEELKTALTAREIDANAMGRYATPGVLAELRKNVFFRDRADGASYTRKYLGAWSRGDGTCSLSADTDRYYNLTLTPRANPREGEHATAISLIDPPPEEPDEGF